MNKRYALITPCRDEQKYIGKTIESVAKQTVKPALWTIVDDGSTDKTTDIIAEAEKQYDYIQILAKPDRGKRMVGPGVVDAFYEGLKRIDLDDFDYICKLDADLALPKGYFEGLMKRMEADPRIGTISGKAYFYDTSGVLISEKVSDEISLGMTKFYHTDCFLQIGGFVREVMWDGIDCHRCRMLGWKACSVDDAGLRFIHLRPMGSSDKNIIKGRIRHGYGQYFMGTGLLYMTVSALYRSTRPPLLIGGAAMLWGYLKSMLKRCKRYDDKQFRSFLRKYQRACLVKGKKRATQEFNDLQADVWNPHRNSKKENLPL